MNVRHYDDESGHISLWRPNETQGAALVLKIGDHLYSFDPTKGHELLGGRSIGKRLFDRIKALWTYYRALRPCQRCERPLTVGEKRTTGIWCRGCVGSIVAGIRGVGEKYGAEEATYRAQQAARDLADPFVKGPCSLCGAPSSRRSSERLLCAPCGFADQIVRSKIGFVDEACPGWLTEMYARGEIYSSDARHAVAGVVAEEGLCHLCGERARRWGSVPFRCVTCLTKYVREQFASESQLRSGPAGLT